MNLLALFALAALLGLAVGLGAYVILQQRQQPQQQLDVKQEEKPMAAQQAPRRAAGVDRMRRQLRQRHAAQQQAAAAAAAQANNSDAEGSEEGEPTEPLNRREARRTERAEARAEGAAAREARQSKINAYEEKRRKKEEERESRDKAQEEEMRHAAEEKQKAEDEEAAKWMNLISVEQTGTVEQEAAADDQGLLGRFIEYIQQRKMVPIEEAATEFGLRSSEVVDRIQGLESMGRLTGVMDERGKFIYISREEMESVAAYIRRKGRVSIAELAGQSNNLIDLEAKALVGVGAAAGPGAAIDFDAILTEGQAVAVA
eukprot:GHRR01003644.1.p1 GENE.GHRR01003644.1~~GHRR01003644.1.p1  ORF type:complete len:315 (+),score=125.81 GHRR01003644.1:250-1194(+)